MRNRPLGSKLEASILLCRIRINLVKNTAEPLNRSRLVSNDQEPALIGPYETRGKMTRPKLIFGFSSSQKSNYVSLSLKRSEGTPEEVEDFLASSIIESDVMMTVREI